MGESWGAGSKEQDPAYDRSLRIAGGPLVAFRPFIVSRPKRLPHVAYVGKARYFLTFCVRDRREAFTESDAAATTLKQFLRTAVEERFAILAYCLMPDHAHLLVEGLDETSDLRCFAKVAKQRSGAVHRRKHRDRLWQEGYFERVLRDDDSGRELARYIINNPVRKGLVKSPSDYAHVGSTSWTIEELSDSKQAGAGSKEQDPAYDSPPHVKAMSPLTAGS